MGSAWFNPTFLNFGGYNPAQYATPETTMMLASAMGGTPAQTNPVGPIGPPPQNLISFGGADPLNAGLLAQRYSMNGQALADQQTRDELAYSRGNTFTGSSFPTPAPAPAAAAPAPAAGPVAPQNMASPQQYFQTLASVMGQAGVPNGAIQGLMSGFGQPFQPNVSPNPAAGPITPGPATAGSYGAATSPQPASYAPPLNTYGMQGFGSAPRIPSAPSVNGGAPAGGGQNQIQMPFTYSPGGAPGGGYGAGANGAGLGSTIGMAPSQAPFAPGGTSSIDQFLANLTNDTGYLQGIAQNAGYPTDATSAWQAMVAAQERGVQKRFADLNANFNASGNRYSTAYGDAATDFMSQTALDQNALLGQMTMQSQEQARGRELSAAQQLAQMGYGGAGLLSQQAFGERQQGMDAALRAALAASGGSDQAAALMAQLGAGGAQSLLSGSITGAGQLFGAENTAGLGMFGAQNQILPYLMQYDAQLRGQGLNTASDLSSAWGRNLMVGSQLGGQQFQTDQFGLEKAYQEWLRTQPQNNPLISMMYAGATAQPSMYYPQYQPSNLPAYLGLAGQILPKIPWDYFFGNGNQGNPSTGNIGNIWD